MNQKELQIISNLRKDARTSLVSVSQSVNVPISTIYDKINRLHKEKIIKKYTALIDFPKLGFNYHAKIALRINRPQKEEFLQFLQNHCSVNSLHEINGGFDFFIETIHKDIKEYIQFIEDMKEQFHILEMQEYQVIEEIEREKFLHPD